MQEWLSNNKEWVFNGIGVAVITTLVGVIGMFFRKFVRFIQNYRQSKLEFKVQDRKRLFLGTFDHPLDKRNAFVYFQTYVDIKNLGTEPLYIKITQVLSKELQNHQSFFKVKLPNKTRKERLMEEQIIALYVICDDFLRTMNRHDHAHSEMSDAEVLTTALVAMLYCGGSYAQARRWLGEPRYIPRMLTKGQFSVRLKRLQPVLLPLFRFLAEQFKQLNPDQIYALDTFPVAVCDNYRIKRCRIYRTESYRGQIASKKRYFYGLKVHLLVTQQGQPVEFFLTPGSASDVAHLQDFDFDLPPGSTVYADKAYNHYLIEDCLAEDGQITLSPYRKKNSKRPVPPWIRFLQQHYRKIVETSASLVERLLPKSIHATTQAGFELKIILFMLAFSFDRLL